MILFVRFKLCELNVGIMLLVQMMLFIFIRRVLPVLHEPSGQDGPSDLFAVCFFRPSTALGASASCLLFFFNFAPPPHAAAVGRRTRPTAAARVCAAGWPIFLARRLVRFQQFKHF